MVAAIGLLDHLIPPDHHCSATADSDLRCADAPQRGLPIHHHRALPPTVGGPTGHYQPFAISLPLEPGGNEDPVPVRGHAGWSERLTQPSTRQPRPSWLMTSNHQRTVAVPTSRLPHQRGRPPAPQRQRQDPCPPTLTGRDQEPPDLTESSTPKARAATKPGANCRKSTVRHPVALTASIRPREREPTAPMKPVSHMPAATVHGPSVPSAPHRAGGKKLNEELSLPVEHTTNLLH
jgi:hypothetical protein